MTPPDVQLGLMLDLPENWDGYGADRIDPAVVAVAQEFVRLLMALRGTDNLFVAPGRDGSVGIEWDDPDFEYELSVEPDGAFELLWEEKASGVMTTEKYPPGRFAATPAVLHAIRRTIRPAGRNSAVA